MSEREIKASHEEVEGFVAKLREFHGSLDEAGQAMMSAILEGAQAGETGGYSMRWNTRQDAPWNDLIGWIEEQGEEDAQGFGFTAGR